MAPLVATTAPGSRERLAAEPAPPHPLVARADREARRRLTTRVAAVAAVAAGSRVAVVAAAPVATTAPGEAGVVPLSSCIPE